MSHVKTYYKKRLDKLAQNDLLKDNIEIDQNSVDEVMIISFIVRIIKLVIVIFCLAYFIGIIYYIYCDITNDFVYIYTDKNESPNNFMAEYFLGVSNRDRAIGIVYFLFTTLSTVGFGDYHPINEFE